MQSKIKEKLKGIIVEAAGFVLDPLISLLMRIRPRMVRRKIAGNVPISCEWTKITVHPPLDFTRNFQAVLLNIEGCWKEMFGKDLKLPDGTIFKPEVEIIGEHGEIYVLESGMSSGMPDTKSERWIVSDIGFSKKLPKSGIYTEVKIRSDKPFLCKTVSWYNYNLK